MMQANYKYLGAVYYRIISSERLSKEVYRAELSQNFFTNTGQEDLLLFYHEDLRHIHDTFNADMINRNLNTAAKILHDKNIKLLFLACPDKFDLYYPYIKDTKGRPENPLFPEMLKVSPKHYTFIDSRKILRDALERGEKDLYWLNDTHWSWKGAELVCDEIMRVYN